MDKPKVNIQPNRFPWATNRKGLIDSPQFVGLDLKEKIEFIRAFVKDQVKTKGFSNIIAAGQNNKFDFQLSGVAKMLMGFAVVYEDEAFASLPEFISLNINTETIIDEVSPAFFLSGFTDSEYYWFPRPLSGNDQITWTAQGTAQNIQKVIFYYL